MTKLRSKTDVIARQVRRIKNEEIGADELLTYLVRGQTEAGVEATLNDALIVNATNWRPAVAMIELVHANGRVARECEVQ